MEKKKKSKKKENVNFLETFLMAKIGAHIIEELKKDFPDLDKPYNGQFKKYLNEYADMFFKEDLQVCDELNLDKEGRKELMLEYIWVESFCKFLDEKGVKIIDNKK